MSQAAQYVSFIFFLFFDGLHFNDGLDAFSPLGVFNSLVYFIQRVERDQFIDREFTLGKKIDQGGDEYRRNSIAHYRTFDGPA
ncbi:hypothetical protein PTR03_24515, partial [Serratia nevei]